jgi:hypothetical protein
MLDANHPPVGLQRRAYRILRKEVGAGKSGSLTLSCLKALLGSSPGEVELLSILRALDRERCIRLLTPLPEPHELEDPASHGDTPGEMCGIRGAHLRRECEIVLGVHSREPDFRRGRQLREVAVEKLRAVRRYAVARGCRRRVLLEYFGERLGGGPCGGCDHCRG